MQIKKNQKYSIHIECSDFKDKTLNDKGSDFEFSGLELIHAITTCGVINPLCETGAEFKYKKYALECQFEEKKDGLYLSNDYQYYDQSEKNCLSYYRGMVFGRLIAYKKFGLICFVHLGNYIKDTQNQVIFNQLKQRKQYVPDIIGWNSQNEYCIWECKGYRSGLPKGKMQKRSVASVNGKVPAMNIVSAVYPTVVKKKIYARVNDPEIYGEEIDFDINKALEDYYTPVFNVLASSYSKYNDNKMQYGRVEIGNEKYIFGLPNSIYEYFISKDQKSLSINRISLEHIVNEISFEQVDGVGNMFGDYIYIE